MGRVLGSDAHGKASDLGTVGLVGAAMLFSADMKKLIRLFEEHSVQYTKADVIEVKKTFPDRALASGSGSERT